MASKSSADMVSHLHLCSLYNTLPTNFIEFPELAEQIILIEGFSIGSMKRKFQFQSQLGTHVFGFVINLYET